MTLFCRVAGPTKGQASTVCQSHRLDQCHPHAQTWFCVPQATGAHAAAQPLQSFAAVGGSVVNGTAARSAGTPVSFGTASYDSSMHALTITGLNHQLACPAEVHVSWDCLPLPGGAAAPVTQEAIAG